MAGDVEVGGNGSVHWRARHTPTPNIQANTANGSAQGMDPQGGGDITVEITYDTDAQAQAAWAGALRGNRIIATVQAHTAQAPPFGAPTQVKVTWH